MSFSEDNATRIQCPPFFDGLLCWPRIDALMTATQPCPPASIMGYANLQTDNVDVLASKVCLANGEWFRNSDGVTWSNYSLCALDTRHIIDDGIERLTWYPRWYETVAEATLLNKWLPIIRTVSQLGYATSFLTLVIAMMIFSYLRKLRNPRNRLHMHLFVSFIMRAFMALLKDWVFVEGIGLAWDVVFVGTSAFIKERNPWVCKIITSLWQYFIVANYSWILMEGLYLHNLIFFVPCTDTITMYVLLGWGIPVLIVVPWIVTRATIEDTLCWTTHENPSLLLVIRGPIMLSILINFLLFINVVRVLYVKLKASMYLQRKKMKYKKWARSTLILVPLFGIHYTFFLPLSYCKDYQIELIWLFCDQLFASFQGTFVAFLYCLLNGEVKMEIKRAWKMRQSKRYINSFVHNHRQFSKNLRDGINRKRHRSKNEEQSVGSSLAAKTMKKLSLKEFK
ncbi:Secretin receptor [Ooceraea biroi]|nr:Secretin receptor [Ooceraea biroi]